MPSKLSIINANTQKINIKKMKFIAEKHKRSLSKELEMIIEKHIADRNGSQIKIIRPKYLIYIYA